VAILSDILDNTEAFLASMDVIAELSVDDVEASREAGAQGRGNGGVKHDAAGIRPSRRRGLWLTKTIASEDVARLFPQAPEMRPG
jgi:hypothetical protein